MNLQTENLENEIWKDVVGFEGFLGRNCQNAPRRQIIIPKEKISRLKKWI